MTDRIADIPQLERKDGIILFLSRINEIERTVVLNSIRAQLSFTIGATRAAIVARNSARSPR